MNSLPMEYPDDSAFDACMASAPEFERIAARRENAIDYNRLFVAKIVTLIAAAPFGIAGLFVLVRRFVRMLRRRVREIRRLSRGPTFRS